MTLFIALLAGIAGIAGVFLTSPLLLGIAAWLMLTLVFALALCSDAARGDRALRADREVEALEAIPVLSWDPERLGS